MTLFQQLLKQQEQLIMDTPEKNEKKCDIMGKIMGALKSEGSGGCCCCGTKIMPKSEKSEEKKE